MAGFQLNLKMELLDLDIRNTIYPNLESAHSKKERILARILQQDILSKLKPSLDKYMNQNNMTGGQVSKICVNQILFIKVICKTYYFTSKYSKLNFIVMHVGDTMLQVFGTLPW